MRRLWSVAFCLVLACGGSVDRPDAGAGVVSGTGSAPSGGGAGGVRDDGGGFSGTSGTTTGGNGTGATFTDPGCPDVPPPQVINDCDPFAAYTGCASDERCSPFVQYAATNCEREIYGTMCVMAGSGVQGTDCTFDACAEHYVCVTTGQGNQCARICELENGSDDCDPGLLCQALDVDGFYICF